MFRGNYNFFDYKSYINGYNGQDYGGLAQYVYLTISIILLIVMLLMFKRCQKENVRKIIMFLSIFLLVFYIFKTTWESIYDIKINGHFNVNLLPLDSCSIIMLTGIISSFSKGKIKEYSDTWIVFGGTLGGIATMLYLNAFRFYPFLSFGAFYSMIWHFLMVFMGLLMITTNYFKLNYNSLIKGFTFHFLISLIIIPIDFIFDLDFMMYKKLGGIPIFENIALKLTENGLQVLNPLIMLILYFIAFNVIYLILLLVKKIV